MNFKKGDKVKIKKNIVTDNWNNKMKKYLGTVMTVKEPDYDGCRMEEDGGLWFWSNEQIECLINEIESTTRFKKGDLVKGTIRGTEEYCITNHNMLKAIVEKILSNETMTIKILAHKTQKEEIGETYDVEMALFDNFEEPVVQKVYKQFHKSLLKPRFLVTLRNGVECAFDGERFNELVKGTLTGRYEPIENYEENLRSKTGRKLDVVEIFKPHYDSIWTREPEKMSMDEVKKEIGFEFILLDKEEK